MPEKNTKAHTKWYLIFWNNFINPKIEKILYTGKILCVCSCSCCSWMIGQLNTYPTIPAAITVFGVWARARRLVTEIRGLIRALEAYDFCLSPFSVFNFLRWTPGLKTDSPRCTLELKMPECWRQAQPRHSPNGNKQLYQWTAACGMY